MSDPTMYLADYKKAAIAAKVLKSISAHFAFKNSLEAAEEAKRLTEYFMGAPLPEPPEE